MMEAEDMGYDQHLKDRDRKKAERIHYITADKLDWDRMVQELMRLQIPHDRGNDGGDWWLTYDAIHDGMLTYMKQLHYK